MSNEEVVLRMLVNRLEQLLEAIPELKSKWEAEITEIIHLGKGVIVEAPESPDMITQFRIHFNPTAIPDIVRRPDPTLAGAYEQDLNGSWHLPLDEDMIECLYNTVLPDWGEATRNELESRLQSLFDVSRPEPEPEYDDDDDVDDDPIDNAAWWQAQLNMPLVPGVAPEAVPDNTQPVVFPADDADAQGQGR